MVGAFSRREKPWQRGRPLLAGSQCLHVQEVWIHPVARWLWLMRDLAGPAVLGATQPASFSRLIEESTTGRTVASRLTLPAAPRRPARATTVLPMGAGNRSSCSPVPPFSRPPPCPRPRHRLEARARRQVLISATLEGARKHTVTCASISPFPAPRGNSSCPRTQVDPHLGRPSPGTPPGSPSLRRTAIGQALGNQRLC
jgi:hypothetical protein